MNKKRLLKDKLLACLVGFVLSGLAGIILISESDIIYNGWADILIMVLKVCSINAFVFGGIGIEAYIIYRKK